ncbi:MAG: acyltransferase family protein [Eubacteriales bacterium]|nr:acyltransferase family protein [Eubacteriales bacterium]
MSSFSSGQQERDRQKNPEAENPVSGKNGCVELLRFLFTSIIILFHINLDLWDQGKVIAVLRGVPVAFFNHGNLGVEFFFLVTGYLMAKCVCNDVGRGDPQVLPDRTVRFLARKAKAIFPYYLSACLFTFVVRRLTCRTLNADYFLQRIPSLFLLQRLGLGRPVIGCTWYLSSMLIALAIAYPLCFLFYRLYVRFAGPVLCAVILCVLLIRTGTLGEINEWFLFTYKTNFRAFAEISLGASGFELGRFLSGRKYARRARVLLSFTGILCLAASLAYICSFAASVWCLPVVVLLFILVVIAFSGEGWLSGTGIFSNRVCLYLGSISLPMYVTQTLFRMYVPWRFGGFVLSIQCVLIYAGVLVFSIALHTAVCAAGSALRKKGPRRAVLRARS